MKTHWPRLMRYYLVTAGVLLCLVQFGQADPLTLSAHDQDWLNHHQTIRYSPETDYGPFVFTDAQGTPHGLSIDFLDLISEQTGIRFVPVKANHLSENLASIRRRETDLLTSLRPTPERATFLGFSQPYVSIPAALIVSDPENSNLTLEGMKGKEVAVGKGYAVESFVRAHFPEIRWRSVSNDEIALDLLAHGQVAGVVADEASFAFLKKQHDWNELQLQQRVGFDYQLSMAHRPDWPELGRIINSALKHIPRDKKVAVLARWLPAAPTRHDTFYDTRPLVLAGGFLLIGATAVLVLLVKRRKPLPPES